VTGVVRPARRPPGWIAPGPAPVVPADRADVWPRAGEELCWLAGDWRILQLARGHRWSLDDLVTAWLAAEVASPVRFADLGCGIGTVLLLTAWRFPTATGVGVEAQDVSVDLARRSIAWNGVGDRVSVVHDDLRAVRLAEPFDLVTGTPPYLPPGTAVESSRAQWGPCHFEHRGGIEDYCAAAARMLSPDGWFVTCAGALQVERVADGAARAGLAIGRRRDVVPRDGKAPLFAVYAMRREATATVVDPPLVVRDASERWTADFRDVRTAMGLPA
jgi:tRNA1Val (adenine37-N6)-methyltransferase